MKATLILIVGIVVLAAGLLFALQGADIVHWPAESFMLGSRQWVEYGIVIMLIGGALILTARRIRKS